MVELPLPVVQNLFCQKIIALTLYHVHIYCPSFPSLACQVVVHQYTWQMTCGVVRAIICQILHQA